jgi:hypothetical protein
MELIMRNIFSLPDDINELKKTCIDIIDAQPDAAMQEILGGNSRTYITIKSLSVYFNVLIYILILIYAEIRRNNDEQQ